MTHQEFLVILRLVLKDFLNTIEGLQALNSSITEVIEGLRFVPKAYFRLNLLIYNP
jgi:hypothetical protein